MLSRMMYGLSPVMRLQHDMNRLFEGLFEAMPAQRGYSGGYPAVNLWQEGDAAWIEAELPGISMNDIEVLVSGRDVTISGERKIADVPDGRYHRRERGSGRFSRALSLPWEIEAEKVEAKFQDGVLSVKLPKAESCKPKKVKVLTT